MIIVKMTDKCYLYKVKMAGTLVHEGKMCGKDKSEIRMKINKQKV